MKCLKQFPFVLILILLPIVNFAQDQHVETEAPTVEKWSFKLDFDSRRTFVQRNSVKVFGVRVGLHKNKFGYGVGYYSSRSYGIFDRSINKNYVDNGLNAPHNFPAEFDFDYLSIFGDYIFFKMNRWQATANTQFGVGRVNIGFEDSTNVREIVERKILAEHSVKLNYQAFSWLRVNTGVGYRYLLDAEDQIKDAFNAPIYIVGLTFNFKEVFKKKKKD